MVLCCSRTRSHHPHVESEAGTCDPESRADDLLFNSLPFISTEDEEQLPSHQRQIKRWTAALWLNGLFKKKTSDCLETRSSLDFRCQKYSWADVLYVNDAAGVERSGTTSAQKTIINTPLTAIAALIDLWNNSLPLTSNATILISAHANWNETSKYFQYRPIMNGGKTSDNDLSLRPLTCICRDALKDFRRSKHSEASGQNVSAQGLWGSAVTARTDFSDVLDLISAANVLSLHFK